MAASMNVVCSISRTIHGAVHPVLCPIGSAIRHPGLAPSLVPSWPKSGRS